MERADAGGGFLEDCSHLAEGLLALYQATFDPRWYQATHDLADSAMARFWMTGEGFYDTATDSEELIAWPRDPKDNTTPSGKSMMAAVLLKLSDLAMEHRYAKIARENLAAVQEFPGRAPLAFGQWLAYVSAASRTASAICSVVTARPCFVTSVSTHARATSVSGKVSW